MSINTVFSKHGKYLVQTSENRGYITSTVYERKQKGRFYKEVQCFGGKVYGRIGSKYPYIKKIQSMAAEEYSNYKYDYDQIGYEKAHNILKQLLPSYPEHSHMFFEGMLIVTLHKR